MLDNKNQIYNQYIVNRASDKGFNQGIIQPDCYLPSVKGLLARYARLFNEVIK